MNYYKQGDAANADKIKAAFEKLGFIKEDHRDIYENNVLFFTVNGDKNVHYCWIDQPYCNIIKTHPDYQELELPVEPKFTVNAWIISNITKDIYQVKDVPEYFKLQAQGQYRLQSYTDGSITYFWKNDVENTFHLWTIEDAVHGDVLATDNGWTCIFKEFGGYVFSSYCFMDSQKWFCESGAEAHTPDSRINGNIHPANKEQRNQFFSKMKEAGYTWDSEKKELKKIPKHYNIINFQPFDKVLVRDRNDEPWRIAFYGYYSEEAHYSHFVGTCWSKQCIPFNEETKHLLGTTEPCPEEYVNW